MLKTHLDLGVQGQKIKKKFKFFHNQIVSQIFILYRNRNNLLPIKPYRVQSLTV